jgi:predicted DNA-binding transcriptional regulator AlpA
MTELEIILRRLDRLEAEHRRLEAMVEREEDRRLTNPEVARHYAICARTLNRWQKDPTMHFPQPEIIKGRGYTWLSELRKYDRARRQQQKA